MNITTSTTVRKVMRAASFALMVKGAVGGSLALLALFGVAVPLFGFSPTPTSEGIVATLGAVLGVIAAFRA